MASNSSDTNTEELQHELQQLQLRKEVLLNRLRSYQRRTVGELLKLQESNNLCDIQTSNTQSLRAQATQKLEKVLRERDLNQQHLGYRLSGRSLFKLQDRQSGEDLLGLRIDTSYLGKYLECYYLLLKKEDDTLRIHKHTIPHFINIAELEANYLTKDVKAFFDEVCDLLHTFVARREMIKDFAQSQGWLNVRSIAVNAAYTLASFRCQIMDSDGATRYVDMKIAYDDPLSVLPTRAELDWVSREGGQQKVDMKDRLRLENLKCTLLQKSLRELGRESSIL